MTPVLLVLGAGALGALLSPAYRPEQGLVGGRRDVWELPDLPRHPDAVGKALALSSAPIFDPEKPLTTPPPAEDPGWRIAAFFKRGKASSVLIQFNAAGKAPVQLKAGDKLPNGERIVAIEDSEVLVRKGRQTTRYGVERRE
ncbi:hypothetical protein ACS5PK_19700 [Roseateles sp. DB2]|uniref:hypothetical protein n=1 Tax=Roseateles sp. DB2 TaxID=3453717 RepID=UPI003EE9E115